MTSNATKEGLGYTDQEMVGLGLVEWCPKRNLIPDLSSEIEDVFNCNPTLLQVNITTGIFVVGKTREVIRNLLETSQDRDDEA